MNGIIIGIYVDDLLALYERELRFQRLFASLSKRLNIVDKGLISKCLNITITYNFEDGIMLLDQSEYINQVLVQFELSNSKPVATPIVKGFKLEEESPAFEDIHWFQQLTGSLLYIANTSRSDIAFPVNLLCKYMSKPTVQLVQLGKRILRFLKGTIQKCLKFERTNGPVQIKIYADAYFGNIINENKSISGLVCMPGNCTIDWSCKKQKQVSTSTCESEVNSILDVVNEAEFLTDLIEKLGFSTKIDQPMIVYNDNQSASVSYVTNGKFQVNRHYRLRLGRIREAIQSKLINLQYCPG